MLAPAVLFGQTRNIDVPQVDNPSKPQPGYVRIFSQNGALKIIDANGVQSGVADSGGLSSTAETTAFLDSLGVKKDRKLLYGSNMGMRDFRARIEAGQSAAALIISDSTGAPTDSWVRVFGQSLATRYPTHRVEIKQSPVDGLGGASTLTVLNSSLTRQYWRSPVGISGGNAPFSSVGSMRAQAGGRYIGYDVEVAPNSDAALSGGSPTAGCLLAGYGSGVGVGWFAMSASRFLELYYYDTDGFRSVQSSAAVPALVVGTFVRYRVQHDTANGANRTTNFYYSTNQGVSWTQVGTTVSAAKATNSDVIITGGSSAIGVGRGNGNMVAGFNYSFVQVYKDANYEPILAERIDAFNVSAGATSNTFIREGSPTIYIDLYAVNGFTSIPGSAYMTNLATHAWNHLRDRDHSVCIISRGHNDTGQTGQTVQTALEGIRTVVAGRRPKDTDYLFSSQNPAVDVSGTAFELVNQRNRDRFDTISAAARLKYSAVDITKGFLDSGTPLSVLVDSGGTHPTTAGYALWAQLFYNNAFLDGTNE